MKHIYVLLLITLMSLNSLYLNAQVSREFGVISQFEKDYDSYNNDDNISCVYLLKDELFETEVFDRSYRITTHKHEKKKILSKASLDEGDFSFSYNSMSTVLKKIRVAIYHKDGTRRIVNKSQLS